MSHHWISAISEVLKHIVLFARVPCRNQYLNPYQQTQCTDLEQANNRLPSVHLYLQSDKVPAFHNVRHLSQLLAS